MASSDEKRLDSGTHLARKDIAMLTPTFEESKMQNASSQVSPNSAGVIAKLTGDTATRKARVQKMPATDRNLESLTTEEIARF